MLILHVKKTTKQCYIFFDKQHFYKRHQAEIWSEIIIWSIKRSLNENKYLKWKACWVKSIITTKIHTLLVKSSAYPRFIDNPLYGFFPWTPCPSVVIEKSQSRIINWRSYIMIPIVMAHVEILLPILSKSDRIDQFLFPWNHQKTYNFQMIFADICLILEKKNMATIFKDSIIKKIPSTKKRHRKILDKVEIGRCHTMGFPYVVRLKSVGNQLRFWISDSYFAKIPGI